MQKAITEADRDLALTTLKALQQADKQELLTIIVEHLSLAEFLRLEDSAPEILREPLREPSAPSYQILTQYLEVIEPGRGQITLDWSDGQDTYEMHIDADLPVGSLRLVLIFLDGADTSAVEVFEMGRNCHRHLGAAHDIDA